MHVTDNDTQANEIGLNDRIDLTNLNFNQYVAAFANGCSTVGQAATQILSGNITIVQAKTPGP